MIRGENFTENEKSEYALACIKGVVTALQTEQHIFYNVFERIQEVDLTIHKNWNFIGHCLIAVYLEPPEYVTMRIDDPPQYHTDDPCFWESVVENRFLDDWIKHQHTQGDYLNRLKIFRQYYQKQFNHIMVLDPDGIKIRMHPLDLTRNMAGHEHWNYREIPGSQPDDFYDPCYTREFAKMFPINETG